MSRTETSSVVQSGDSINVDNLDQRSSTVSSSATAEKRMRSETAVALTAGPFVERDGQLVELRNYQQTGTVRLDGDTIVQQLGRDRTATYSLKQLAQHSKDPAYLAATVENAAKHNRSIRLDVQQGVVRAVDDSVERRLPRDMPLREPILRAATIHDVDPVLLAAVGVQETHLGADYLGKSVGYNKVTHRGDVTKDSPGGHGYGPFQYDDDRRHGRSGRPQGDLDRVAGDPYVAADKAAEMLFHELKAAHGNVRDALHVYNSGRLSHPSSTTDWGHGQKLSYEDSTLLRYRQIEREATAERGIGR